MVLKQAFKLSRDCTKLFLDRNENHDTILKEYIDTYLKSIDIPYNVYPDTFLSFYNKLKLYLNVECGNIITTNGSEQALQLLLIHLSSKYKNIVKWEPTFGLIDFYSRSLNLNIHNYNFIYSDNAFFYTYQHSYPSKSIFYISTPNSPTGSNFCKHHLKYLIQKYQCSIFIIDEAYVDYADTDCLDLYKQYNNVIIVRTFSKAWGIAGLRVGYFLTKDQQCANLQPNYAPNIVGISAASFLLDNDSVVRESVSRCLHTKNELYNLTNSKIINTTGNFILLDTHLFNVNHLSDICLYKQVTILDVNYIKLSLIDLETMKMLIDLDYT